MRRSIDSEACGETLRKLVNECLQLSPPHSEVDALRRVWIGDRLAQNVTIYSIVGCSYMNNTDTSLTASELDCKSSCRTTFRI